jgi:TetR/AcrR family transcriptional repressor of mexCD-oprJ operon
MAMSDSIRDRVSAAILETAGTLMAARGTSVTMAEIADTAGVGRATVYRYFPNRNDLLSALSKAAVDELADRIAEAAIDSAPVGEAIARLARAFVSTGHRYGALVWLGETAKDRGEIERRVADPLRALFERGIADGTLREDLPAPVLFALFAGLLEAAISLPGDDIRGVEQIGAAVATLFLDGARHAPSV